MLVDVVHKRVDRGEIIPRRRGEQNPGGDVEPEYRIARESGQHGHPGASTAFVQPSYSPSNAGAASGQKRTFGFHVHIRRAVNPTQHMMPSTNTPQTKRISPMASRPPRPSRRRTCHASMPMIATRKMPAGNM